MTSLSLWPFKGLAARVAGTLALALLPIGAIAVFQAVEISRDEARRQQNALLTATAEAAAGEALAVANASGAAGTLAAHVSGLGGAAPGCSRVFSDVVDANPQYSFAGFVDGQGIVQCGSSNIGDDLSGGIIFPRMQETREQIVSANLNGPISGTSVILVATPVFHDGTYIGYVSISVPHRRIPELLHGIGVEAPETAIVTFNASGTPLSSSTKFEDMAEIVPANMPLDTIVTERQYAFTARSATGEARNFAVVPIIPGVVYALGSVARPMVGWATVSPILFPTLMLIAGLVVAFQAVNWLVIRHIRELQRHMVEFSQSRRVKNLSRRGHLSRELEEIETAWIDLASHLLHDEAELENAVHEKNVLLKEVHHRVKNNLQLIASIVSLKIRRASSDEARRSLREVQMRVRSIASVHQSLYTNPSTGRVRADELLTTVIDGIIEAGVAADRSIEVTTHYDPVLLYPDQAVPFLLLASEAVTNALKYMGRRADGMAFLRINLEALSEDRAELVVANTCGVPFFPPEQVKGSGLGRSLIAGFATQANGSVSVNESDDLYDFHLTFAPAPFDPEGRDATFDDIDDPSQAAD